LDKVFELFTSITLNDFSSTVTCPGWFVRQPDRKINKRRFISLVFIP